MAKKLTSELRNAIIDANIDGVTRSEITAKLGLSLATVDRVLSEFYGLQPTNKALKNIGLQKMVPTRCRGCGGMITAMPCKTCEYHAEEEAKAEAREKARLAKERAMTMDNFYAGVHAFRGDE